MTHRKNTLALVGERAVTNVVQEACEPQTSAQPLEFFSRQPLHKRRCSLYNGTKQPSGYVHGTKAVHEPGMHRSRVDKALQKRKL
jgi:hypothetical protein